ncbi:NAD(P)H dehydrogenase (quinone) [uncultured bacterium]|nr:NAD(P)H dehydrogenase (quinone) [uncultured bacterium]
MPSRTLVTGATGTVGFFLVRELSKRGEPTRAAVHTETKAARIAEANIELFEMDFADKASIDAALKGIEKVYLLTPFSPGQVEMAGFFIDRAVAAGVKYIVRQSVAGADTEAITLLRGHRMAEVRLEESGIPYTHLRPNSFMQNFSNFFGEAIRATGKIYLPLKAASVSYIDARDIALVGAALLSGNIKEERLNRAYALTGPAPLTMDNVAASISRASGRPVEYMDISPAEAKLGMKAAGMPEWAIESMIELYEFQRDGRGERVSGAVEEISGRSPLSIDDFARDNAHVFRSAA